MQREGKYNFPSFVGVRLFFLYKKNVKINACLVLLNKCVRFITKVDMPIVALY